MKYSAYYGVSVNTLLQSIGERISSRRKELGLSRAALAQEADVSARFWLSWSLDLATFPSNGWPMLAKRFERHCLSC